MKFTQLHKTSLASLLILSSTLGGSFGADEHTGDALSGASMGSKKALFEANKSTITPTNSPLRDEKLGANTAIKKLASKLDGEAEHLAKQKVDLAQRAADAKIKLIQDQNEVKIALIEEQNAAKIALVEKETAIKINKIEQQVSVKQQELSQIQAQIDAKKNELETMQRELDRLKKANEELATEVKLKDADAIVTWSGAQAKIASVTSIFTPSAWYSPTKQPATPKQNDPQ